jgi:DNA-binding MarR family transcriptional regulator
MTQDSTPSNRNSLEADGFRRSSLQSATVSEFSPAPDVQRTPTDHQHPGNGSGLGVHIETAAPPVKMPRQALDGGNGTKEHAPSACGVLRTASRAVTQFYDLVLAPTGLKATQFILLQAIHESGEVAQCDFAREHTIAVATLSRRFSGLRKKGYIQIRMGERHGERIYRLTGKGIEAFQNALPFWERAQHRLRTALGEGDWHIMMDLANRVRIAARAAEQLRTDNQVHLAPALVSAD